MAKDHSADLMQSLISKLYKTVTGSDASIKMPRNKFITWMLPEYHLLNVIFYFVQKV